MATWTGKTPVPGRETDRMISQAYSGGFALLAWIFLAALLLIATSKEVMPAQMGFVAWLVHPLSCVAALAAIASLFNPQRFWPTVIPAVMPLLIAGYVLYAFYPSMQTIPMLKAGAIMWTAVGVLSISVVPAAVSLLPAGSGSIEAKPGPEMDAFEDKKRQQYRDDVLNTLRQTDEETRLYELSNLVRADNPALPQVLDVMRKLPLRQADAIQMLESLDTRVLTFLADIDLDATPQLCTAARGFLHGIVQSRLSSFGNTGNDFVGMEFSEGVNGIRWIAKNCGCKAELAEIEAYARQQKVEAPAVSDFLTALTEIRDEK